LIGQSKFIARVSAERIVCHQLLRHGPGQGRLETAPDIDRCKLPLFAVVVGRQLGALACQVRSFRVGLRADGDVFAGRHRKCAGYGPGNTRQENVLSHGARCGDTDDQAGGRNDSVVRTENGGAEPARATRSMTFMMPENRSHACFFLTARLILRAGR
jgi:hypothetical protein